MSSHETSVVTVAMSSAHDGASSSKGGLDDDQPIQIDTFINFTNMPKELRSMVWKEAITEVASRGIQFVQLYNSKDRRGRETSQRTRLDKHSASAYLARIKLTCSELKEAVEKHVNVAILNGEEFHSVTVTTHYGETQVQINAQDVIAFGSLHEATNSLAIRGLPTDRGGVALPRTAFPRNNNTGPWSWIRRIAMSFPLYGRSSEAFALAGHTAAGHRPTCYYCIAWNLSGLRNLEQVYFIVEGLAKPTDDNPYGRITKISADLYDPTNPHWSDMDTRCTDFEWDAESDDEDEEELAETETDSSLEVFKGASREYYQVRLAYYGRTGQAHHALRHFARDYGSCLEERLQIFAEPPRANFVNFKLLSYED